MLTEFSIGNYQAFSAPQRVPLKPITLIFGPNSAGKSSLLRSLLVARHAILNGRLSKSEGAGERHPGSFADIVRNGGSNDILFEFTVQPDGKPKEEALQLGLAWNEGSSGGVETMTLSLKQRQSEVVTYATKRNAKHLQIESLGDDLRQHEALTTLKSDSEDGRNKDVVDTIKNRLCLQKNVAIPGSDADHFRIQEPQSDNTFTFLSSDFSDLIRTLEWRHKKRGSNEQSLDLMQRIKTAIDSLKSAITYPIKAIGAAVRDDLTRLIYHGPIRPICNEITREQQSEPGMTEWWELASSSELLAKVNNWLANDKIFKTKYRLEFNRMLPDSSLDQLSQSLSRWSSFEQLVERAFQAKLVPGEQFYESVVGPVATALEQDLKDEYENANERVSEARWRAYDLIRSEAGQRGMNHYKTLRDGFEDDKFEAFLLEGMNGILGDLSAMLESVLEGDITKTFGGFDSAKVRFCNATSSKAISPSNMGIGFSQMMPLVASAFGSENRLIAIEQPELHIHPALQTELADLFIRSAKERGNRFLIETHSEHLILRVMRRIRETTRNSLPDGIKPEDVAVLYVQPGENGSTVQELRIDDQGRFLDNWPQGFFEERLDEMF